MEASFTQVDLMWFIGLTLKVILILYWVFAHFIGDYLFQNDYMAIGKKTSNKICLLHVGTYLIPFLPSLFFGATLLDLFLIGVQHYLQDRGDFVKQFMKMIGKTSFLEPPWAPWSIVVIDNILHIIWIVLVGYFGH